MAELKIKTKNSGTLPRPKGFLYQRPYRSVTSEDASRPGQAWVPEMAAIVTGPMATTDPETEHAKSWRTVSVQAGGLILKLSRLESGRNLARKLDFQPGSTIA